MSDTFDCDFYFGDSVFEPLKQFNPKDLKGFKKYLHAKRWIKSYIYYTGIRPIFSRKYTHYILTGDVCYIVNWLILLYAFITRKKVFCWCHGLKGGKTKTIVKWEQRLFYNSMDGILLYNNYNIQFMRRAGIKSCIHVIHNSLNTPIQTQLFENLHPSDIYVKHFGNSHPVVIYIGRIQKRMKVQYLIEAMDLLNKRGKKLNAVIVGAYMDGVDIKQLVKDKHMDNRVWFYGPSFDEDINSELLYNACVCVAPGTVGLTAIHSLSYGTPCITHDNHRATGPEFESIVPGKTGDFFRENDVRNLADTMSRWIELSSQERDLVRKQCRAEVERNWSISSQIKLLTTILK